MASPVDGLDHEAPFSIEAFTRRRRARGGLSGRVGVDGVDDVLQRIGSRRPS